MTHYSLLNSLQMIYHYFSLFTMLQLNLVQVLTVTYPEFFGGRPVKTWNPQRWHHCKGLGGPCKGGDLTPHTVILNHRKQCPITVPCSSQITDHIQKLCDIFLFSNLTYFTKMSIFTGYLYEII